MMDREKQKETRWRGDRGERLHGAWSGGFSAGYYNTVGSAEGFQPRTFRSSRAERQQQQQQQQQKQQQQQQHQQQPQQQQHHDHNHHQHHHPISPLPKQQPRHQRAEDFMDDEDLEDHAVLQTRAQFQTGSAHGTAHGSVRGGGAVPGISARSRESQLASVLRVDPNERRIGVRLLKSMGWRAFASSNDAHAPASDSTTAAATTTTSYDSDDNDDDDAGVYGVAAMPPGMRDRKRKRDALSAEPGDESGGNHDMMREFRVTYDPPRANSGRCGLGFEPSATSSSSMSSSSTSKSSSAYSSSAARVNVSGDGNTMMNMRGFGMSALDDDDDYFDVYGGDRPDASSVLLAEPELPTIASGDDSDRPLEFVAGPTVLEQDMSWYERQHASSTGAWEGLSIPVSVVPPRDFRGKHRFDRLDDAMFAHVRAERLAMVQRYYQSRRHHIAQQQVSVQARRHVLRELRTAAETRQDDKRAVQRSAAKIVATQEQRKLMAQALSTNFVIGGVSDVSAPSDDSSVEHESESDRDAHESQTSATSWKTQRDPTMQRQLELAISTATTALERRRNAAVAGLHGPLTRAHEVWVPESLLCKRFGVTLASTEMQQKQMLDHHRAQQEERRRRGLAPMVDVHHSGRSGGGGGGSDPSAPSSASIADDAKALLMEVHSSLDHASNHDVEQSEVPDPERPPVDLFKAIFEAASDADESDDPEGDSEEARRLQQLPWMRSANATVLQRRAPRKRRWGDSDADADADAHDEHRDAPSAVDGRPVPGGVVDTARKATKSSIEQLERRVAEVEERRRLEHEAKVEREKAALLESIKRMQERSFVATSTGETLIYPSIGSHHGEHDKHPKKKKKKKKSKKKKKGKKKKSKHKHKHKKKQKKEKKKKKRSSSSSSSSSSSASSSSDSDDHDD